MSIPVKTTAMKLVKSVIPTSTITELTTEIRVLTALLCLAILKILTNLTNRKTLIDLESIVIKNGKRKGTIANKSTIPKKEKT
tara:strand:- start:43 stop:291 length:249 start_codon:yes stop_codon:yes gene_type:complete